jgi:hypothetical protein
VAVTIHAQIKRLSEFKDCDVSVGNGPKHTTNPNVKLAEIVDAYFKRFPFLLADTAYVEFMECYAGACLINPETGLVIDIFGFTDASSDMDKVDDEFLWQGESSIILEGKYLVFCDAALPLSGGLAETGQTEGTGFAFDASGTRKKGIYRAGVISQEQIDFYWYCDSFARWLDILIETRGRFAP